MSQKQPPGPLIVAFIGGLMGAVAALVITAIVRDIPTMEALRDPLIGDSKPLALGILYAAGRSTVKTGARVVAGGVIGAMAGLVIYCIAYVLIFSPSGDDRPNIVILVAEAMYSFTPSEVLLVAVAAGAGAILSRY